MEATVILKKILETWDRELWVGLICIRTGASCGLLNTVKNIIVRWRGGGGILG